MLSDFVDKFLDEGWHDVVVTDVRTFTSKNGTDGVEFTCQAAGGASAPAGLFLTPKALPRFVRFASAGKNTPFMGRGLRGKVVTTLVDGRTVFEAKN